MNEMVDAIDNLQLHASLRFAGHGEYRSAQQDQDVITLVPREELQSTMEEHQCFYLPYDNDKRFVGRVNELRIVESALSPAGSTKQRYLTIWGLGGVGKSQLALAFANRSKSLFDIILWTNAETEEGLLQSFTNVAMALRLQGASPGHGHSNHQLVQSWLLLSGKYQFVELR